MKLVSTSYSLYCYFVSTCLLINRDYHYPPMYSKNISFLDVEKFLLKLKKVKKEKYIENWEEI
jgi:hypothetical protein